MKHRAASRHPRRFREQIHVDHAEQPFATLAQPWQRRDIAALDPAWMRLAGRKPKQPGYQRAYLERPRGHSKTTDIAIQLAWIIQHSPRRIEGVAAAADTDQAGLIRNALARLIERNPRLCSHLIARKREVVNPTTGSRLTILSSDVQSSWGLLPDFVICDELTHWEKPDLWYSLISSAAKKPNCLLVILSNAGVGRGWQWEVREAARESSRWYFSTLQGCQAPWISDDWLDEQRSLLPEAVFDRLWNNRWQLSEGSFVTLPEAEACRDASLTVQSQGRRGLTYFAAIDYAEKHDYTVGVVLHRDDSRLVVDRMDVVKPRPDQPTPVAWVENWIEQIALDFGDVRFIIDEYQLLATLQKFDPHYHLERFAFAAGKGNQALAMNLRQLILERKIAWYPDCGSLPTPHGRDDLETELASVLLAQKANGLCRIDHRHSATHHDDRTFALGAAALKASQQSPQTDWLNITHLNPGNFRNR